MARTKKMKESKKEIPLYANTDIHVFYELPFGKKDVIVPGTILKIKNTQGTFRYMRHAHNVALDKTWVDTVNTKTFAFHSFYIGRIRSIVKPKKSRAKKVA